MREHSQALTLCDELEAILERGRGELEHGESQEQRDEHFDELVARLESMTERARAAHPEEA